MKAFLRFCLTKVRQSPMLKHRLLYFVYGCIGVVTGSGTTWYFDTQAAPPPPTDIEQCTVVPPPEEPIRTIPSEQDRYRALLQQYQSGEL